MAKKRSNGEGSITKRKDGRWQASISLGKDPKTGKQKRDYIYGKTRKEVADKLQEQLHDLRTGVYIENTNITVSDWMDTWLETYKRPSIRPKTYESYEYLIRVHIKPAIGHIKIKDLKPAILQNLYNTKIANGREDGEGGLSPRTVKYIHTILHQALEQAVQNNIIHRNVSTATSLPKQSKKEINIMSEETQSRFLEAVRDERLGAAFFVEMATGARLGELLALRWADIDLEEGVIRVSQALARIKTFDNSERSSKLLFQQPKTAAGNRSITIQTPIVQILKEHKRHQNLERLSAGAAYNDLDLVFCTEIGNPIEPTNLIRKFKSILKKHEFQTTNFHSLRHTYASRLLEANVPAKVAQDLLGHSSITMTLDLYTHVLPETKAQETKKLTRLFEGLVKEEPKMYSIV